MRKDCDGKLYDVYYIDGNGEGQSVRYFGHSKRDAERLFNSERLASEKIISIEECK